MMMTMMIKQPNRMTSRFCNQGPADALSTPRSEARTSMPRPTQANKRRRMTSKYRGVHIPRRQGKELRYIAKIYFNGKGRYIGAFASETEAAMAYDKVALNLKGKNAQLNFPEGQVPEDNNNNNNENDEGLRVYKHTFQLHRQQQQQRNHEMMLTPQCGYAMYQTQLGVRGAKMQRHNLQNSMELNMMWI